ncbi:MAG: hypothetical protein B7Z80_09465 [Rhodospirillales bacterium 20-64-7]|nr:MAG: hypothetical protein B7Z80_09465 [Rhodospirillales bacterium 20-64-7]HQT76246.1 hypothetical protein [Rhodopila sp.]
MPFSIRRRYLLAATAGALGTMVAWRALRNDAADNSGRWAFHGDNLHYMEAGMTTTRQMRELLTSRSDAELHTKAQALPPIRQPQAS